MPLYSDENRIRELERKINRLIQDNRDLKQQVTQANQGVRAIAIPQAQGGQQPTIPTWPVRGALVETGGITGATITAHVPSTMGTGTCTIYKLSGSAPVSLASGINVYSSFAGTIAQNTWILVAMDDSGAYQVIAEQC